jgi:formylglycine-generating enzyme required for sulfatase activity
MKLKFLLLTLFFLVATQLKANNMLVKNVTTTGNNATNKTIQVQFDMSWDNSWRDGINWDAAWVFMKFKDANGLWQHVQLNTTGFANGTGTANTIQVGSDKVGAFVYRSATGTGTFASTTMQLQWNYGLSGLTNVTGLEVRVFAIEMVYVPQGDFTIAPTFSVYKANNYNIGTIYAPANNIPVINSRLTPTLTYTDLTNTATVRIKGDAGIDTDNNGTVDVTTYPIGYNAFYCYKYELTEQQYADFLNTLTTSQITTLGVAGTSITLTNGQYFTSTPNRACGNSTSIQFLAYADWSGVRPMSLLEFNKASYGPILPVAYETVCCPEINTYPMSYYYNILPSQRNGRDISEVGSYATASSSKFDSGATYYGMMDFTGNVMEPCVHLKNYTFTNTNGNGVLGSTGATDVSTWSTAMILYVDHLRNNNSRSTLTYGGFRYVRSAE